MVLPKYPGKLITFEGGDGSGKSGQIEMLRNSLREMGFESYLIHEPGGTRAGEEVSEILKATENYLCDRAELLGFMMARAQVTHQVIKPKLEAGIILLCDRFTDSSVAYQVYGRGLSKRDVDSFNNFATCGIKPDITFFLDVEPAVGLARAKNGRNGQSDRIEDSGIEFHEAVRRGYYEIAKAEPNRVKIIDTNEPVDWDEIHQQILANVELLLSLD